MPRPKKKPPRKDGRYEVKIVIGHDLDGKAVSKSFYSYESKRDAEKKAEAWRIENGIAQATGQATVERTKAFEDWARSWLEIYKEDKVRRNTYTETYERTVEKYLIPHFGRADLTMIKPVDVQLFMNGMATKYTDSTLHKIRLCLNGIFETAIENELCYKNPVRRVTAVSKRKTPEKKTYTREQVARLYAYCDNHEYGLPVRVLAECGLRCSELCGLHWRDIDTEGKQIYIRQVIAVSDNKAREDTPKTKSSVRVLPISTVLSDRLAAAKREHEADEYFVATRDGKPFTSANYTHHRYNKVMDAFVAQDVDAYRLSPHELRHTCGTLLYEKTKDIFAVSKYLGHANIGITTKLYVHENPDMLRNNLGIE